jgi:hypothetical protein
VPEIDSRGTSEAIFDAYGEAGIGGTLHNKAENFATISGGTMAPDAVRGALDGGDLGEIVRAFRTVNFFYLLPSMGLLLLAPIAMAVARRRGRRNPAEWRFALTCFVVFSIGVTIWGLLVFGNGIDRTLFHIGSYLLPMLGFAGAVAGLRATFPRFAVYYVALASLLSLALYAPSLDPPVGSYYLPVAIFVVVAALASFVAVALLGDGDREEPALLASSD